MPLHPHYNHGRVCEHYFIGLGINLVGENERGLHD